MSPLTTEQKEEILRVAERLKLPLRYTKHTKPRINYTRLRRDIEDKIGSESFASHRETGDPIDSPESEIDTPSSPILHSPLTPVSDESAHSSPSPRSPRALSELELPDPEQNQEREDDAEAGGSRPSGHNRDSSLGSLSLGGLSEPTTIDSLHLSDTEPSIPDDPDDESVAPEDTMAATMARAMPRRTDRGAPAFDGDASGLMRYFDDVRMCCEECGITDGKQIKKYLVRYTDATTAETWESLMEYEDENKTVQEFQNAITRLFPGMEPDRKYNVEDLAALVLEWQTKGIRTKTDLGEFHQAFLRISAFLLAKERTGKKEVQRYYLQAYGPELRKEIVNRLCTIDSKHHQDDPFEVNDVYQAANFFLFGTAMSGPLTRTSESGAPTGPTRTFDVKKEELSTFQMLANLLKETLTTVASSQAQSSTPMARSGQLNPRLPFQPPTGAVTQPSSFGGQRPNGCVFCGGTHFIRECAEAQSYVEKGLAGRNERNQICLPNGYFVPGYVQGANLKERIDNYYKMTSAGASGASGATAGSSKERDPPPHLSANLLEMSGATGENTGGATIEEISDDEVELERLQAMVLAMEKKVAAKAKPQKKVTFDGVVIPVRGDGRKERSTEGDSSGKGKEQSAPAPTKSAATNPFRPALKDGGPQFRYVSAVEDSKVMSKVLDRMLDSKVEMTNREVLAISNEVRKGVKELVQTKKVGSGGTAEMLFSSAGTWSGEWSGPGTIVKDSLPLRTIDGMFEDKIICECVLDQGAQFIAVRKDVWKAMDIPRYDDRTVLLEAANQTKSKTLGQASMRVAIGPIVLSIVAHVVESAPFEVLLGRPFYAATQCLTKDYSNGEQEITLTGPNGEGTITLATKPKSQRRAEEEQEVLHTGF